jgi:RHS repeat-associated protein
LLDEQLWEVMPLPRLLASCRAVFKNQRLSPLPLVALAIALFGCPAEQHEPDNTKPPVDSHDFLEPPGHAPGEPHAFIECPDGACAREHAAYLFSGEFHESVVDLRVSSCSVGLDLVWARRYRSRLPLPRDQARLGNGWDHSYNIYLDVGAATLHDGNARPQVFEADASGEWTAPRYHRFGKFDGDGRFELTFADGGRWIFKSAEESAQTDIRKLSRIVDRNGNVVELEYDTADRLERVINASGQSIELEYGVNEQIVAVVAKLDGATERRVTYEYYGTDHADGNSLDLQRVTRPAILDTVTDNDFPTGTTTRYTYSTGAAIAELDGNLLTIEDALGQVYLRNTYAATSDPADFEFDRLLSQQWGDVGDTLSLTYAPVTPGATNGFAVTKARLTDRVGRVSEHFFDASNQLVLLREYTGFADPQPREKLRAADPTYFETRYDYNADGHVRFVQHPAGNVTVSVYEGDLDPRAPVRTRGNLRQRHSEGGTCDSGFAAIHEYYEYEPGRGNEHGEMDFVTRATDPRGNVTEATYDGEGNQTAIIHPEPNTREDMEYSAVGQLTRHRYPEDQHARRREVVTTHANDGRLRETIVDPDGFALTTIKEYDAACNEVRRVDPRGNDTLYIYNDHDQLIREWSPVETCSAACGGGTPARAFTDRIYDANMNVVRVDYQALQCSGSPEANAVISTAFEYDTLNEVTATRMETGPDSEIVNRLELDANREVSTIAYGAAAAQTDPDNRVTTIYDERGRVFREIRAHGSAQASTTQHDYDLNGNETTLRVGLEGPTRTTTSTYDCADRLIATVDPMGNRTEFDYDPSGNVVEQRVFGEVVDLPGSTVSVLLERVTTGYDSMNRVVETSRDHIDPITQAPVGDGESVSAMVYDGESRAILEQDDNGHVTAHDFDTAGRSVETIDALGNTVELAYDDNGNVVTRTVTDVPSIPGDIQTGVWTHGYDAQNNVIETIDPLGSTWHECYDSLGNRVEAIDPRGNRTLHTFDGAGRLLETTHVLTDDGTGSGSVVGYASTVQRWDASDRLIAREDPSGNATAYEYDSLNRLTLETFADGTTSRFEYDIHDNVILHEDANGTIVSTTYDALERPIEVDIDAGAGVNADTTFESFAYDGRSLLVRASDDDSEVTRFHDSLGELLVETQTYAPADAVAPTSYPVRYTRDGLGNATTTWYPAGRQIVRSFDGRQRTKWIAESGAVLVELDYLGPNVLRRSYIEVDTQSHYAYDLARRMISSEHIEVGNGTIDRREYTFDEAGNKQSEDDLTLGSPTGLREMQHDSMGRMVGSDVSASMETDRSVDYAFDGAGNRTNVSGDACPGPYSQDGDDALINQYTATACEVWSRDSVGNLIGSEPTANSGRDRLFEYDHRGRLVNVWADAGTVDEIAFEFAYDALGRKIHSTKIGLSAVEGEQYVYDDWNVIEEYPDESMNPRATYLYSDRLDERLQRVLDDAEESTQSWWYFDDELGSTSAVARREGGDALVVERYAYQDYGDPTFLTPPVSGNPYLFAGGRRIADVGLYDMRTRHLDPTSGRFISRDTLGIWGDEENLGNGYTYVGNMPDTHTDPTGESKKPTIQNCHVGARDDIEDALDEAQRIAIRARDWFNQESNRKRKHRKKDWNKQKNDGRRWWGKYDNTRFRRIMWNYRKIAHRCQKDVITFKCRSTGEICGYGKGVAWTHSMWSATIRLCKNSQRGFFLPNGSAFYDVDEGGGSVMHEISHNVNAIGDKELNGKKPDTVSEVQNLAKKNPLRASWNANNYEEYAEER